LRGLLAGGIDLIMVETVFDTLNAKAAIYAIESEFQRSGVRLPVMVSGTITDASGRTLSGQTPEAFWISIAHAQPLIAGLNCALGAEQLRPHVESIARAASCYVSVHPNAGLPNEFGGYDQSPAHMARLIGEFAASGFVNLVGGCCGTTPEHIEAIAAAVADARPRALPNLPRKLRLSGLEPLEVDESSLFVNVGERTNVTGSARFKKLIREGALETALDVARDQVDNGAQIIDVNMDEGMLDGAALMTRFLNLVATEPDIARVPVMVDSEQVGRHRSRTSLHSRQTRRQFDQPERRRNGVHRESASLPVVRCRGGGDGLRRTRAGGHACTQGRHLQTLLRHLGTAGRVPAEDIIFDPNIFAIATGIEEHNNYAMDFIQGLRLDQATSAVRAQFGWRQQRVVLVQRQRHRSRSNQRGVPVPRDSRGTFDGHRQRGSARHLRRDSAGVARSRRRRRAESSARRHRPTAGDLRRIRGAHRQGGSR
jgi:5-methyltetrahydrofolate--homocysteine methyltransferase